MKTSTKDMSSILALQEQKESASILKENKIPSPAARPLSTSQVPSQKKFKNKRMAELILIKKVDTNIVKPNKRYSTPKTRIIFTEEPMKEEKVPINPIKAKQHSLKKIKREVITKESHEKLSKAHGMRSSDPGLLYARAGKTLEKELAIQYGKSDKLDGWDTEYDQQGSPVPFGKF